MSTNLGHTDATAPATNADHATAPGKAPARPATTRLRAGLGIAALVGVIATSGVTASLGSSINTVASPSDTTCCTLSRLA